MTSSFIIVLISSWLVENAKIWNVENTDEYLGMVVCESAEVAATAKAALDGTEISGKQVSVTVEKSEKAAGDEEVPANKEENADDEEENKLKELKKKNEIQRKKGRYLRDEVYDSRSKMRRLKENKRRLEDDKRHYEKSEKKDRGEYLDEKIKLKKARDECKIASSTVLSSIF